tara:strand:+ start:40775 stop:41188 length:414 start_codon:yes stop_codon:yes gene_type:complete
MGFEIEERTYTIFINTEGLHPAKNRISAVEWGIDTMNQVQFSKFSPITVAVKRNVRQLRLNAGYSMYEGARLLGVSRKQLEDIETIRNYGCHLDLELLAKMKVIYKTSLDVLVGEVPEDYYSDFYVRPRKRLGSKSR